MIFVDTGAWIALSNPRDQHSREAVAIYDDLEHQEIQLLTTDFVIDETVTRLRYDESHWLAVTFLDTIEHLERGERLTLLEIDDDVFAATKALFRQYDSARLSFTDCTSFVVCRENNITEAFAFDQHFAMMGIDLRR